LLCAVLLILSAAILHTRPDPHAALGGTAAAILLLCALTGGMITARTAGSRALLCGACSAAMSFLLCWIASLCTTGEVALYTRGITLALRGAVVLFALLGASLGLNFPRKR
jgi:putative membrane protein (TIGR04086 family)